MYTDFKTIDLIKPLPDDLIKVDTTLPTDYAKYNIPQNTEYTPEGVVIGAVENPNKNKEKAKQKVVKYSNTKYKKDFDAIMDKLNLDSNEREFLTKLASKESAFNPKAVATGVYKNGKAFKARGAFQFTKETLDSMGIDENDYDNNLETQIRAAMKLRNHHISTLQPYLNKGYTMDQLVAGAWLGGLGGVKAFLERGENRADKFGTSMKKRMEEF